MSANFQSLFTIQILHDYYDLHELKCSDFEIVPSSDCELMMKNMQVLHKNYGNKFYTVINAEKQVEPNPPPTFRLLPFISFRWPVVFRYYLKLKNSYFSNYTAITLSLSESKCLYFSNLSKNTLATTLSLSNPVEIFTLSKIYIPGDLVKGPDDNVYETIRLSDDSPDSKDLTSTRYWKQAAGNNTYVTAADQVSLVSSTFNYRLKTPSTNVIIKVFSLNQQNPALPFDQLLDTVEKVYPQAQEWVNIDLSRRKPGKYRIVVNSEEDVWVYVDPIAAKTGVYGIIEMHQFDNVPADFRLIPANGQLRIPEAIFTIHFKNRSVIWRYISQNGDIGVSDSSIPPNNFIPSTGAVITSERAIELTEKPIASLSATKTSTGRQLRNLRNPDIGKLLFEKEGDTGFYSGNMYVKIDT